jgi:hypothetical protein
MNNPDSKVCPSCGCEPWNFAEGDNPKIEGSSQISCEPRKQPQFCQDCGDKLILRSELPRDIWKDPYVRERLRDGVPAWDIAVFRCPKCHELGYYNEGSSFSCRFCNVTFRMTGSDDEEIQSLADTVTETTDNYPNQTQ